MNIGFAEAFYFVARLNRRDQHHDRVLAGSRTFRAHRLTTDLVWMEVADALAKSACRPRIRDFMLQRRPAGRVKSSRRRANSWTARWTGITSVGTSNAR